MAWVLVAGLVTVLVVLVAGLVAAVRWAQALQRSVVSLLAQVERDNRIANRTFEVLTYNSTCTVALLSDLAQGVDKTAAIGQRIEAANAVVADDLADTISRADAVVGGTPGQQADAAAGSGLETTNPEPKGDRT